MPRLISCVFEVVLLDPGYDMDQFNVTPIGYISTPFKERFGTPRQPSLVPSSWGTLTLKKELNLNGAFEGLEGFSHVWLIFQFHENENKAVRGKIHPPRMGGEKIGLFATRTPHRPNAIGLSAVKLDRVEGSTLHFSGVDLVDGTPILDVKPYLPSSDSLPTATAGWTTSRDERTIEVRFTASALEELKTRTRERFERFKSAITEILSLDPRPVFYRGTAENPNPYTDIYGFRFDDLNVVYRMEGNMAEVTAIETWDAFTAP
ncbi:MAG: tRNA (N6-threonylcarbamoyladenosine(37)-N6)-methyltransferase TrmO [Bdellovibrionota bacterium]